MWCWPEAGAQAFLGVRELSSSGSLVLPALRGLYPVLQLGAGAVDHGAAGDAHRHRSQKAFQGFPEVGGGLWSRQGALTGQMGTRQQWDRAGTPGSRPSSILRARVQEGA